MSNKDRIISECLKIGGRAIGWLYPLTREKVASRRSHEV